MDLKYCKLDLQTASIDEIKDEIQRLESLRNLKWGMEQGIKIFINSIYGALASIFFAGYNTRIAEAITLQGQELTKYAKRVIDRYFIELWHKDKALHQKMGITDPVTKVFGEATIYGDTDSVYVSFWEAMQSCGWKGTANEFILQVTEHRLQEYINKCFDIYADKCGCDQNLQQLELEKIADSAIILAKKKYVLDITWKEPDIYYESLQKITSSGVEIVQSSTPAFAREKLNVMLREIFKHKENLKMADFVKMLNQLKVEFKLADIQDISMSSSIGDYEKFILNDRDKLEIGPSCPIHVRGAGIYNFLLNKSKFKSKYNLITTGDKIKYYYAVSPNGDRAFNAFGYLSGNYPYEFAPPADFDMQFQKAMVEPLSRFTVAMGYGPIPEALITSKRLF